MYYLFWWNSISSTSTIVTWVNIDSMFLCLQNVVIDELLFNPEN